MLRTRILTALALLPVMLFALFQADRIIWTLFTALITLLACWEWGRFLNLSRTSHALYTVLSALLALLLYRFVPKVMHEIWSAGILIFWFMVVPFWLRHRWKLPQNILGMIIGWGLLYSFWWAFLIWRPDPLNVWRLLSLMILVWLADTAAYFFGRRFGRRKLAVQISPGKTWEGVLGALFVTGIYGLFLGQTGIFPLKLSMFMSVIVVWLLVAVSIMGDLIESLFKRQVGLKDSSQLLPGHGGILDRFDSLIAVLPVALALFSLLGNSPS